jgi:hypothetical protein
MFVYRHCSRKVAVPHMAKRRNPSSSSNPAGEGATELLRQHQGIQLSTSTPSILHVSHILAHWPKVRPEETQSWPEEAQFRSAYSSIFSRATSRQESLVTHSTQRRPAVAREGLP